MDIKKACRNHKPITKASKHLHLGVAGGRISPPHSNSDVKQTKEILQKEIEVLKQKVGRRNIKVSKVAEA